MTKTIEDPVDTTKTPPDNEKSPARKRRKTAIDDGELVATRTANDSPGLLHTEFTEAIDLTGISPELKEKMYAVAPILRGKEAVYTREFFTDVVGLCGRGILVGKLVGCEEEIGIKCPVRHHRYEIVDCLDSKEAASFADHWSKVYGESPDNNYFSLRFLRGCYVTFVHKMEVNWAQEALDRQRLRQNKRDKNPRKLGTIALRQQIEAICKLVAEIEGSPGMGTKSLVVATEELQQCQQKLLQAKNWERSLLTKLKDARAGLEGCYAADESGDIHVRYSQAVAEAKSLRTTGTSKEAAAKRTEAEALLVAINESSKKTKEYEDTIADIEEEWLPKAMAEVKHTSESVDRLQERVKELTMCPGCKNALAKLENLTKPAPSANPPSPSTAAANPPSPSTVAANVDLPNPPYAVADARPASSQNCALEEGFNTVGAVGLVGGNSVCQCSDSSCL